MKRMLYTTLCLIVACGILSSVGCDKTETFEIPLPALSDITGATGLDLIIKDIDGVEVEVPVHVDIDPENYVDVYTLVLVNPPNVVNVDVKVDVPDTNVDVAVVVDEETVMVDVIVNAPGEVYVVSSTKVNGEESVLQDVEVKVGGEVITDVDVNVVPNDSSATGVCVDVLGMPMWDPMTGMACE